MTYTIATYTRKFIVTKPGKLVRKLGSGPPFSTGAPILKKPSLPLSLSNLPAIPPYRPDPLELYN